MDIKTKSARSRNMSAIHSKNTKPEVYFRKLLFADGFRYRCNVSSLEGHPDLWLKQYNTVVFIHGCFWHHHAECKYAYTPKSNTEFWKNKFVQNRKRDQKVTELLLGRKYKVLVIWECTIKRMKKDAEYRVSVLQRVEQFIRRGDATLRYLEL